jgi:nitrous oxidase accessory protein NosD
MATGSGIFSGFGIALLESTENIVKNNRASSNGIFGQGICLMSSSHNTISSNDVICHGPMGQAIAILQSSYNVISKNCARSSPWGVDMEFEGSSNNRLSDNEATRINGDP